MDTDPMTQKVKNGRSFVLIFCFFKEGHNFTKVFSGLYPSGRNIMIFLNGSDDLIHIKERVIWANAFGIFRMGTLLNFSNLFRIFPIKPLRNKSLFLASCTFKFSGSFYLIVQVPFQGEPSIF